VISVLSAIWEAAGYPWSVRLKALLPVWMPWAQKRFRLTPRLEQQLLRLSPRTIDYRLRSKKRQLKKRIYGRTKPGTLLKHHIPVKTDNWDVHQPGFTEVDLVSHAGSSASGDCCHSLNLTDIQPSVKPYPLNCWALTPTTVQNLSMLISITIARPSTFNSLAAVLTRKMTTLTSSKRTGLTCVDS
jgi:hypothetical protein